MQAINVRDAVDADLPRISEIKVQSWADTYSQLLDPAVLRPFLDQALQLQHLREDAAHQDTLLLVAMSGEAVTGFALAYLARPPEPWLESLHVDPELRGRGIGTRLLGAMAARLETRGYRSMWLGVVSGNVAAARLYERLGAELIGVEPADWAQGVTHELYRWRDLASLRRSASATAD